MESDEGFSGRFGGCEVVDEELVVGGCIGGLDKLAEGEVPAFRSANGRDKVPTPNTDPMLLLFPRALVVISLP